MLCFRQHPRIPIPNELTNTTISHTKIKAFIWNWTSIYSCFRRQLTHTSTLSKRSDMREFQIEQHTASKQNIRGYNKTFPQYRQHTHTRSYIDMLTSTKIRFPYSASPHIKKKTFIAMAKVSLQSFSPFIFLWNCLQQMSYVSTHSYTFSQKSNIHSANGCFTHTHTYTHIILTSYQKISMNI